ncbi:MAG: hypothetical protein ACRDRS_16045 [Pseudonocardiaceae bacterium]
MSSTAREGVRTGMPTNGSEAASLVESAMLLRWRAPELALLLADRAVTAAPEDTTAVRQADHLAVFALNRLGRHAEAVHRLFPAVRDADTPLGLRHALHVELAQCAVELGEPAAALDAVRTVLAAGDDVAAVLRGRALVAVAEASVALGRDDLVPTMLDEADELYREDPGLDHDTALLLRATARATSAARHRRRGASAQAEAKAREGRNLLAGLADPEHDSGEVSARLMLEIVLALLDRGAGDAATQEVRPLLRRPVRAAAAGAVGALRLALATRVHLAEGRHEPALTLLADAVEGAQRHGVDAVLAECLEGLSHVHEARGEFADALHCMRAARAAESRHRRDVEVARATLLENCGATGSEEARLIGEIVALLGDAGAGCAGLDSDTMADNDTVADDTVAEDDTVTEDLGATPRESGEAEFVESLSGLDPWQLGARHGRDVDTPVFVSDLLPATALSPGRSGRRRAMESAEDRAADTPEDRADDTTASIPPLAPTPRPLAWASVDHDEASRDVPRYRVLGTRRAAGLALAPRPTDGDGPAAAVTNPLLRLPDLTAEPQWVPPATAHQPAVGD